VTGPVVSVHFRAFFQ